MGCMGTSSATASNEDENDGGARSDECRTFLAAMEELNVTETMMTCEAEHWRLRDELVYDLRN